MHYDTLIIGAGLSGLAAGIRLAYFDQQVCTLERHTTIGGLNSFYRLRNRNHDVGLHAVTNFAKPGTKKGPLSKLLRQLRIGWDDFPLSEQNGSEIRFPGCTLRFSNDFEQLREQIHAAFPTEKDNFARLHQFLISFDELNLHQKSQSARDTLGRFLKSPMLIDMLFCPLMFYGSATPDDMDLNQFVVMYKSIFMEGFGRPYNGVRPIMKTLVRQYKKLGGELRLRAGVKKILTSRNQAIGVELEDGTQLTANRILSSAGAVETDQLCPQTEPGSSDSVPTPQSAGDVTFNEIIDTLDVMPAELGHNQTIIFFNNSETFSYRKPRSPCDLQSGIICSPNNFQYEKPLKEGCIRMTALANHDFWLSLPESQYKSEKAKWTQKIRQAAIQHLPKYQSHIIDTDAFTPKTIRHYTGHINGCVYGAPKKSLDGSTRMENLFLCGTDQGFLGIIGSMLSGITMANNHCLLG